jgi:DNA-binding CsgD family transcriptional regulator
MPAPSPAQTRDRLERVAESTTKPLALFGEVASVLRQAMPLDGWCGHTLDPATAMPTGGDSREGFREDLVTRLLEIEYRVGDVNPFNGLLQLDAPVGNLRDATGGAPGTSPRYREVVTPSGFEHEMRVVFRHHGRPWGAIVLLRAADAPAFSAREADLMASVSASMAVAIKRGLLQEHVETGGVPAHAGLLLLDGGNRIDTVTPEAARWLQQLSDGGSGVPLSVQALASSAADSATPVRSRARVSSGAWVTMTAWSLGGTRTAVSLESSAPHDLTALALDAYSLSPRERQVVELVLLGHSTAQIGRRLFLSPYTVQDHLKSVFDKTGVRSRRELAADLFFRHYLPRIERGASLSSDGWFADELDEGLLGP